MRKVFLILMFTVLLVSGCKGKEKADTPGEQGEQAASLNTYTQPAEVSGNYPTSTESGAPSETLSPTPNAENDRPAPPTEGSKPTATRTPLPSVTRTFTPSATSSKTLKFSGTPTVYKSPTTSPSPTRSLTPSKTPTPTTTYTASPTSTGTLPTPTPSNTPSPTFTATKTPTEGAPVAFTVQFESHYSCAGYEFLTFYIQNTGTLPLESNHVLIEDTQQVVSDSFTNWPFQTLGTGCDNDLGVLQPGESAYLPVVIGDSPAPPPYPEEHTGTFTFCSEENQGGSCEVLDLNFTIP